MTSSTMQDSVHHRFIEPFLPKRNTATLGIETEFPLACLDGSLPRVEDIRAAMEDFGAAGYTPDASAPDGFAVSRKGPDGTTVSFDTSYLNFEFSFCPAPNLLAAQQNFDHQFALAHKILAAHGLRLYGAALNACALATADGLRIPRAPDEIHEMEYQYLKAQGVTSPLLTPGNPNFFTSISSLQAHFDVAPEELPLVLNLLSAFDFLDILLFANSPALYGGEPWLDARYAIYQHNGFAALGLTGSTDTTYRTMADIERDYATRHYPWGDREGGKYIYSYRNTELSTFGTVEYRMTDTQPLREALLPAAFLYGLMQHRQQAYTILHRLHQTVYPGYSNNQLCLLAARPDIAGLFSNEALYTVVEQLLDLAMVGLTPEEQPLLAPLKERIRGFYSPAKRYYLARTRYAV